RVTRPLSEDAYPRRPAVLREILLHAWRLGLPYVRYALWEAGRSCVLGPVVSGGRASGSFRRRGDTVLSHRHRLASGGEAGIRHSPARCLADHTAVACH